MRKDGGEEEQAALPLLGSTGYAVQGRMQTARAATTTLTRAAASRSAVLSALPSSSPFALASPHRSYATKPNDATQEMQEKQLRLSEKMGRMKQGMGSVRLALLLFCLPE